MTVIAFLGPSLSRREARALVRAELRPPARQGDVFRALEARPRAIALIDGVFESSPSVWHHELIAARACGVHVYGAASMGALRAAELPGVVTPIGEIAERYLRGQWEDDGHVALLHGDEASGFRALTLPHVNVWATARRAVAGGVLSKRRGAQLVAASEGLFYQVRTWTTLLEALDWPGKPLEALREFVRTRAVDLKAEDARACLRALAKAPPAELPLPTRFSSFVRRSRITSSQGRPLPGSPPVHPELVEGSDGTRGMIDDAVPPAIRSGSASRSKRESVIDDPLTLRQAQGEPGATPLRSAKTHEPGGTPARSGPARGASTPFATEADEAAGTRTLLLAELARLAGLSADEADVRALFDRLPEDGWAADERMTAAEALALEALVLQAPEAFVSDGPSRLEGARLEQQRARLRPERRQRS